MVKSKHVPALVRALPLSAAVHRCFRPSAGIGLLACLVAGMVQAADEAPATPAADSTLEAIDITGSYEKSLLQAVETKRNSNSIIESISAEDIGKLPDSSIAESIARLPGIAGQRVDGRMNSISVRGFGEAFSTTTFNGREQLSISDNRDVEFDLYPSEIMSGVDVYKTPDSSLVAQGIGGVINLKSVRPLEAKKAVALSADYEKNQFGKLSAQAKDTGGRGTFSYVDQFDDKKLGVAFVASIMDSPNQEYRWQSWGYATDPQGNLILGGAKPFVRSSELFRDTAMAVIEAKPTSALRLTGDALFIHYKDSKILKGIEIPGPIWGANTSYTESSVSNGFVNAGTISHDDVVVRNDFEYQQADMKSIGFNAKYDLDKDWVLEGDVNHSMVSRDIFSLESYSGVGRCPGGNPGDTIGFNMNGGSLGATFSPGFNYADPSLIHLGGPQCWANGITVPSNAQDGFINYPHVDDHISALKLSAQLALANPVFSQLEFGFNYTDRSKSKADHGVFLTLKDYPAVDSVPAAYQLAPTSLSFIGMGNMLSYDSYALWKSGFYNSTSENLTVAQRSLNTWTVREKVSTLYVKADIDSSVHGVPVNGNIGLQAVSTNQSSDGFAATNNSSGLVLATPTSGGSTYANLLPSANAIFHLADNKELRLGLARTMSRMQMDRENASYGYSYDTVHGVWSGTFSNTAIKPQLSDQLDAFYNWYYRKDGFLSVGAFYKHLTQWQTQQQTLQNFAGFTLPSGITAATTTGVTNQWVNNGSGFVKGIEIQGILPGSVFSPVLDGFGLSGSASFMNSSLSATGQPTITVPGLSNRIFDLTGYFEKHGFGARISLNQRSDFLGEELGTSFVPAYYTIRQTRLLDGQLSYSFSESNVDRLKNLTITFQVQNMTNEPLVTYFNNDPRQVRDYQKYGADYLLGVRYKF